MGKKQIQTSLKIFTTRVKKAIKPKQILLFGSYATGKASDYSDVDILVVSDKFSHIPNHKRIDILYNFTHDLTPDFHVYGLTPKEYESASPLTIVEEIKQHNIPLI